MARLYYFRNISPVIQAREARDLAREKELILATCSHELRTPLNGILNMMDMIELNPAEQRRYIKIARHSSRLMLSLVNDMLDFSSIVSKKFRKKVVFFKLEDAVNEAADLVRFLIEEKGLQLFVSFAKNLPKKIYADRDRLSQVIINLLSNAYKYTMRGKIELMVSHIEREGISQLKVAIVDTGIGIRQDDQHKLFQLFTRIREGVMLDRNGIGLGLTICRNMV